MDKMVLHIKCSQYNNNRRSEMYRVIELLLFHPSSPRSSVSKNKTAINLPSARPSGSLQPTIGERSTIENEVSASVITAVGWRTFIIFIFSSGWVITKRQTNNSFLPPTYREGVNVIVMMMMINNYPFGIDIIAYRPSAAPLLIPTVPYLGE